MMTGIDRTQKGRIKNSLLNLKVTSPRVAMLIAGLAFSPDSAWSRQSSDAVFERDHLGVYSMRQVSFLSWRPSALRLFLVPLGRRRIQRQIDLRLDI
jgi:hypothetical protein